MRSDNRYRIIQLLKNGDHKTRQEISKALGLSMPTTLQCVDKLLTSGIIEESGENASTGGRRAKLLSLKKDSRYCMGIQITRRHVRLAHTNLLGEILTMKKIRLPFCDEPEWYREFGDLCRSFLDDLSVDPSKFLGAGLSFPGIIDQEKGMILHSHVFGLYQVSLDRFIRAVPMPLVVVNDANCACYAERSREESSWFYLSLNESVGGAFMTDNRLVIGNNCRTGEAGHVVIHPKGKKCYCGKRGCADAYLASTVLVQGEEEPDDFFGRLQAGDPETAGIWEAYLEDLALLISNLNMILDTDIVLGGDIGARMDPYIEEVSMRTKKYDLFSRDVDYILPSQCKEHIFLTGAALRAIDRFADEII